MRFAGKVWRYIPATGHPLDFQYLRKAAGRWNREGQYGCLYTALTPEGAVGELRKYSRFAVSVLHLAPHDLVSLRVVVEPVLDLADPAVRARFAASPEVLTGDEEQDLERCRHIADVARAEGYWAIRTPSAAETGEQNLNLYYEAPLPNLELATGPDRHPLNYGEDPLLDARGFLRRRVG